VPKFFGGFQRQTMMQVSQFKWVPNANAYSDRVRGDATCSTFQEG
jgi:hypothetical protein